MHDRFLNAYITCRGDLAAIAKAIGVTPLKALELAIHPDIAPKIEHFLRLEKQRHLLAALARQSQAAEVLSDLLTDPALAAADRRRTATTLASLSKSMAAASKPPARVKAASPALDAPMPPAPVPSSASPSSELPIITRTPQTTLAATA